MKGAMLVAYVLFAVGSGIALAEVRVAKCDREWLGGFVAGLVFAPMIVAAAAINPAFPYCGDTP